MPTLAPNLWKPVIAILRERLKDSQSGWISRAEGGSRGRVKPSRTPGRTLKQFNRGLCQ
jgi:hypothetical protein